MKRCVCLLLLRANWTPGHDAKSVTFFCPVQRNYFKCLNGRQNSQPRSCHFQVCIHSV